MTRLKNVEFAEAVGCNFTTASKLRSGTRAPSLSLFARIIREFNLDANDAIDAYLSGRDEFTAYLREMVFEPDNTVEASTHA